MFNRILVPLDGSPFAEAAFPAAIAVAERVAGEIRLLSVRPHLWADEAVAVERALDQEAWAYLADATTRVRAMTSVPVSNDMRRGAIAEEIVAEAASHDLIVMTSHGRGGFSRLWLGSVTDACLRSTEKPVLVVRPAKAGEPAPAFRVDRVVVPLDGSTVAECAVPPAVAIAEAFGADILLVRSVLAPVPLDTSLFPAPDWVPADSRELIDGADAYLEDVASKVKTTRRRPGVHVELGRHPADAVGEAAGEGGLVVMAAHTHSGLRRAILGSVTDKVVRTADGAVLVVRPPHASAETIDEGIDEPARVSREKKPVEAA
jgi:nucleotide-binding universal stress UspA family protein